jgi:hypothetical protein
VTDVTNPYKSIMQLDTSLPEYYNTNKNLAWFQVVDRAAAGAAGEVEVELRVALKSRLLRSESFSIVAWDPTRHVKGRASMGCVSA